MKDLKKIQEFFSKPLEEVKPLATQPGKYDGAFDLGLGKGHHIDERMDDVDNFAGSDPKAGSMIQGRGFDWDKNTVRSTFLKKERAQLMRDREQEAEHHIDERMDDEDFDSLEDAIANREFGMDYNQLGPNEKEWVRDEMSMNERIDFDEALNLRAIKVEIEDEIIQLRREMEDEGDESKANYYGGKLNKLEDKLAKVKKQLDDYDMNESVGKSKMPTQSQVDRFFTLTQNETHYLNSKPVQGQKKTSSNMEVEPWDGYDLSNWNSLVRKAKAKGKSLDEATGSKVEVVLSNQILDFLQQRNLITGVNAQKVHKDLTAFIKNIKINTNANLNENNSYARVSMPRFKKDKNNPNFLNVYIDYDLGPGGSSIALGKETMTGQIRRESAAEAMRLAGDVAKDLEAEYNLEDIDIQDLENGKVRIFAVSDDFINMDPNMLGESLNENLNPEVSNAVNRFIKAMAKRYDYSEQDAVYAIMAALKQRKFDGLNESQEEDEEVDYSNISSLEDELRRLRRWSSQYGSKGADSKIEYLEQRIEYLKSNPLNEDESDVYRWVNNLKYWYDKSLNAPDVRNTPGGQELFKSEVKKWISTLNETKEEDKLTVAEKVIAQLKEAKPGLWANINAKQKRGEKPSHGNSDAFKSAVKAGKKINKLKEEEGVPHYTKDGKLYDGPTHKDASGKLMTGDTHTSKSEYLSHKEDLNELRQGLFNYLKQQLPNTPEYVVKDMLYPSIKTANNAGEIDQEYIDQFKNIKWVVKTNFSITMDIFTDRTKQELESRIGGTIKKNIPNDAERLQLQKDKLKSQGISKEPIILFKTKDGKYDLAEGKHRTIEAFKMFPEGFIQPNVYIGLNAKWLDENLSKLKEEEDTSKIEDEFVKMMTKVASQATSAINAQTPVKISPELEKKLDEGQLNEFIDPITIATLVIGAPGLLKLLKWISQAVGWLIGQNKDGDNKFSKAFEKAEHKLHKFYIKLIGKGIKKAYPVYNAYTQEEVDILANKIYLGILTAALVASGMAAAKAAHGVIAAAGEGIHAGVTASDIVAIAGELATEV
jgi:hypothetical protein